MTLPGWGAAPVLLGTVLALVGLFALNWVNEMGFSDLNKGLDQAAAFVDDRSASDQWNLIYFPQGAIIALFLAAIPAALWTLGSLRSRESIRRRGGLMKRSLGEGNTGPTRIMISVIAGLCLLYHVISLIVLTDSGEHLDDLGPGPWTMVAGLALITIGAVIGPRVPGRAPYYR